MDVSGYLSGSGPEMAATGGLALMLSWIVVSDLRDLRIPDAASLPLILCGLAVNAWGPGLALSEAVIGAGAGYAVFALLGEGYFRLRGQEGLGLGDAKLLAAAGAWLGWCALPMLVLVAAVLALAVALVLRRRRLAFGPWLALAFWTLWVMRVAGG